MIKGKTFKGKVPFYKRKKLCEAIETRHPSKIPVILESKTIDLSQNKFLVPDSTTVAYFLMNIRNHITSIPDQAAYYLITGNGIMLTPTDYMRIVQSKHKEECGFLFVHVEKENMYG